MTRLVDNFYRIEKLCQFLRSDLLHQSKCLIFEFKSTTMLKTLLYIALGGAIGSVLRYLTTVLVSKYWSSQFPLATFIANVLGCFLIGFLIGILEKNNVSNSHLKWFLMTGFCGGYTTFSAFGYENYSLFQSNNSMLAFTYIGLSVFVGIMAVGLGLFISK